MWLSPSKCDQHNVVTNMTLSPKSLLPYFSLVFGSWRQEIQWHKNCHQICTKFFWWQKLMWKISQGIVLEISWNYTLQKMFGQWEVEINLKTLIGRIMPNTTEQLEWDEVHAILSDYSLDGGGCWSPPDCQPRHSGLYFYFAFKFIFSKF